MVMGRTRLTRVLVAVGAFATAGALGIWIGAQRGVPFVRTSDAWSIGLYVGDSPLTVEPPGDLGWTEPILTGAEVTDTVTNSVADPFLFQEGDELYIFFEIESQTTGQGELAYTSRQGDGDFKYGGIVLDEPFHLSYPQVFKHEGSHYMLPETHKANEIRLYRADNFPRDWKKVHTIATGDYSDPTITEHGGYWWIFAGGDSRLNADLHLFHSESLMGEWTEHPMSPVVRSNPDLARPGGGLVIEDGKLHRITQDCWPSYGVGLSAVEVTELTPTRYSENPVPRALFTDRKGKWNRHGIHQLSVVQLSDGSWLGAVDGKAPKRRFGWSL